MKNMKKLAAGFIAAAMAMTMSLSAFADAVVPTISTDKATLNIGTGITTVNGAQTTMMAYVVPGILGEGDAIPAYDEDAHEIIALDQVDGATGIASVPVDAAKLENGNSIVVKISGTDGVLKSYVIAMQAPVVTYSVTYELAGGTVANAGANTFDADDTIAAFFAALEDPSKAAIETETYEFAGWSKTADGEVIDETSTALMTTLLDEGSTSITLYAKYTATAVTPNPEEPTLVTVYLGDINSDNVVDVKDFNQMKAYNNLTAAQKGSYKGKVGTMIGTLYIGDINADNVVDVKDFNQMKAYNNLTAAQKGSYKGKVGTTVQTQVQSAN